jgi:predicted MFS family arabinose efflux permease
VLVGLIGFLLIGASLVANLPLVLAQMQTPSRDIAWILSLFGIGQLAARALDYAAAKWLSIRATVMASSSSIVLAMGLMAWSESDAVAAAVFVLLLGAGNGLVTTLRGVLPTQLFQSEAFAKLSGQLARYGAFSRALMPMVAAQALSLRGGLGMLSLVYGLLALLCGWILWQQLKAR